MNFDREAAGLEPIHKITIPLEEYKELLIIKGKYEELKHHDKSWITRDMFVGVTGEHLRRAEELFGKR